MLPADKRVSTRYITRKVPLYIAHWTKQSLVKDVGLKSSEKICWVWKKRAFMFTRAYHKLVTAGKSCCTMTL